MCSRFPQRGCTREARTGHRLGTRECPKVQPASPLRLPASALRVVRHGASLEAMIADVDASLRSLLRATALHGSTVDVVFDLPTKAWSEHVAGAVVDAYLWEVREDVTRRQNDWEDIRNDDGRVVGRKPPLHRYRLRYLLTAWGGTPADEHRLLSSVLASLADQQAIPSEHVGGDLVDEGLPVYLTVALPADADNPPTDLWGALGIAPRPALDLVVTAPLPRPVPATVAVPVRERVLTVADRTNGTSEVVPTKLADERRREALAPSAAAASAATRTVRRRS